MFTNNSVYTVIEISTHSNRAVIGRYDFYIPYTGNICMGKHVNSHVCTYTYVSIVYDDLTVTKSS